MSPTIVAHAKTFMTALAEILAFWDKAKRSDSLVSYTKPTMVEPIMMIDERVMFVPYINDIAQTSLSIFSGWYLQAAALSCTVNRIDVGKFLGHLNPARESLESHNGALEVAFAKVPATGSAYDFRYGLPTAESHKALESQYPGIYGADAMTAAPSARLYGCTLAMESDKDAKKDSGSQDNHSPGMAEVFAATVGQGEKGRAVDDHLESITGPFKERSQEIAARNQVGGKDLRYGVDSRLHDSLTAPANMAIGRVYTVQISDGGHQMSIPVTIRFLVRRVDPGLLVHILGEGSKLIAHSAEERDFAYQLGDLRFWRDIVACKDLIADHKKALLADTNGVYNAIVSRRNSNRIAAVKTATPSVGTASNVAVVSRQTIRELEKVIGGKFDHFDVRQRVFGSTELIMVIVVDSHDDHVTYYYRDTKLPTELTVSQIKASAKGNGPDVADILKAFTLGQAPSL